ncbi:MAG: zinc-ribbon domain-containing protein, partial [Pseudobutyrivibrio sp.]|nr:zinc-ribbon domain-containing protein [Pseudobutyrivibrio sp.]
MALITCPECGQSVSDKASVCIHCGFPLAEELNKGFLFCPYCGAKNENTMRVCKQCGKDIVFE